MKCCVIIVNYRVSDLTLQCLRSLVAERGLVPGLQVIVVDNNSGDGSAERLRQAVQNEDWSEWVQVLPLDRNGGFAFGNNAAIRRVLALEAPPEHLLLLNPDTIVRPGAVRELVEFLQTHPQAGIAGSRLEDPDGTVQPSAFRFHSILSELENGLRIGVVSKLLANCIVARPTADAPYETDWVSGASLMARREVFQSIGLLDEGYFMYFEEVDFCLRASRAGFECWHVPQSRVVHLVGKASGINDAARGRRRRPAYWFQSRRRYFLKNHGRLRAMLADLAWAGGFASYRLRRIVQRKPDADPPMLLRDFLRHSTLVPHGPDQKSGRSGAPSTPAARTIAATGGRPLPRQPLEEAP